MAVPNGSLEAINTHMASTSRILGVTNELGKVYIKAKVNDVEYYCLLDTGCDVSVFPRDTVAEADIKPTDQRMVAANGTSLELVGETEVWCNFGEVSVKVKGLVSERVQEIMLGGDFLTNNGATWNFADSTLSMHSRRYPLYSQIPGRWCRQVVLRKDTEVPAWNETALPGNQHCRDTDAQSPAEGEGYDAYVAEQQGFISTGNQRVSKRTKKRAERQKERYDLRVNEPRLQVGSWVWRFYPRRVTERSQKWQKFYGGPFLVTHCISPTNYVIQKGPKTPKVVAHVDQLKKYQGDVPQSWVTDQDVSVTAATIIGSAEPLQDGPSSPPSTEGENQEIVQLTLSGVDPAKIHNNELPSNPTTMGSKRRGTRIRRPPDRLNL